MNQFQSKPTCILAIAVYLNSKKRQDRSINQIRGFRDGVKAVRSHELAKLNELEAFVNNNLKLDTYKTLTTMLLQNAKWLHETKAKIGKIPAEGCSDFDLKYESGFWAAFGVSKKGVRAENHLDLSAYQDEVICELINLHADQIRPPVNVDGEVDRTTLMPIDLKQLEEDEAKKETAESDSARLVDEQNMLTGGKKGTKRPKSREMAKTADELANEEALKKRRDDAKNQSIAPDASAELFNQMIKLEHKTWEYEKQKDADLANVDRCKQIWGYLIDERSYLSHSAYEEIKAKLAAMGCDMAQELLYLDPSDWTEIQNSLKEIKKKAIEKMLADMTRFPNDDTA